MSGSTSLSSVAWDDGDLAAFATAIALELRVDDAAAPRAAASREAALAAFAGAFADRVPTTAADGVTAGDGITADRRYRPRAARRALAPWTWPRTAPSWRGVWSPRFAAVSVTAVLAVSLTAGAAAASVAGGPLYPLRLAVEAAVLPADPTAREAGEVGRLGSRVGEVEAAAGREDDGAMLAGLGAFAQIADETAASAVPDPAAAEQVAALVARLERLRVTADSTAARDAAVMAGQRLVLALSAAPGPTTRPPSGSGAPAATPMASPSPRDSGSGGPGPGASSGSGPDATGGSGGASPAPSPSHGPSGPNGTGGGGGPGPDGAGGPTSSTAPAPAPSASPTPSSGSGGGGPQPSGPGGSAGPGGGIGTGASADPSPGSGGGPHVSAGGTGASSPAPSPSALAGTMAGRG